jgi:hypothetical protein
MSGRRKAPKREKAPGRGERRVEREKAGKEARTAAENR